MTVCQLDTRLPVAAVKVFLSFLTASQWTTSTNRDDSRSLLTLYFLPRLSEAVIMQQNKHAVFKKLSHAQNSAILYETHLCYSATCTPVQLSLLSDAMAKYSSLHKHANRKDHSWVIYEMSTKY